MRKVKKKQPLEPWDCFLGGAEWNISIRLTQAELATLGEARGIIEKIGEMYDSEQPIDSPDQFQMDSSRAESFIGEIQKDVGNGQELWIRQGRGVMSRRLMRKDEPCNS
ncbi:MAG: hypothetical protein ACXQTL_03835 [Methanosarcinales archaeon]